MGIVVLRLDRNSYICSLKIMPMKQLFILFCLFLSSNGIAQAVIQSINSGSIIGGSGSIAVGEIVVVPQNQTQSASGILGLLSQVNQTLEVPQLTLNEKIVVYPNPTVAAIYFQTNTNLVDEKVAVYNMSGKLISEKNISTDNSLDLSQLPSGVYLITFANQKIASFKIIKR